MSCEQTWCVLLYVTSRLEHLKASETLPTTHPRNLLSSLWNGHQQYLRWLLLFQPGSLNDWHEHKTLPIHNGHVAWTKNMPLFFLSHWDLGHRRCLLPQHNLIYSDWYTLFWCISKSDFTFHYNSNLFVGCYQTVHCVKHFFKASPLICTTLSSNR